MKIDRFNDYNKINEEIRYIPILDFIVSKDGIPLIGDNLTKGKVDFGPGGIALDILNLKGEKEIAGVNKNGDLIVNIKNIDNHLFEMDNIHYTARCLHDGNNNFIKIPENYLEQITRFNRPFRIGALEYWAIDYQRVDGTEPIIKLDYTPLIPIIPTGWVNIKVDMEVSKRIKRYSEPLGRKRGDQHQQFLSKLEDIEKTSNSTRMSPSNISTETIQKKMSTIMILHYLNEIKDFFNPTQSGFLFESFLSGLIPDSKVVDDDGPIDVISNNKYYQIKLYSADSSGISMVKINEQPLHYYVIALKDLNGIVIYILHGEDLNDQIGFNFLTGSGYISPARLRKGFLNTNRIGRHFRAYLDLSNIDGRINKIAKGLKKTIQTLYDNISSLEYNVETIITGVDEKGNIIKNPGEIYNNTKENIKNIEREILALNTNYFKF